jgi:hypothetical protein
MRVGLLFIVGGDELRYIHEVRGLGWMTRSGIDLHSCLHFSDN